MVRGNDLSDTGTYGIRYFSASGMYMDNQVFGAVNAFFGSGDQARLLRVFFQPAWLPPTADSYLGAAATAPTAAVSTLASRSIPALKSAPTWATAPGTST